jgi:hypothetical protein
MDVVSRFERKLKGEEVMAVRPDLNGHRIEPSSTSSEAGQVFLILDGVRRHIPDNPTYDNLFIDPRAIDKGDPITQGAILMNVVNPPPNSPTYLLIDKTKRHISTFDTFNRFHFAINKIVHIPQVVLDAIPDGPEI